MEGINKIFCGSDVKNTGVCDCFFDPKLITGGLLIPKDKVFTEDELKDENIQATLEAAVQDAKNIRIFPLPSFNGITDNSEDDVVQTFGYGSTESVREGNYNWLLAFRKGGVNLNNNLRTFNGLTAKYRLVLFESQNTIIGTSRKDVNGDDGLGGIPLEDLKAQKWKVNDGTNLTGYGLKVAFKPEYINELIAFKKVAVSSYLLSELAGLEDIKLEIEEVDEGTNTITVSASSDCGSTDMGDEFGEEMEQVTAWLLKNAEGEEKTITGVVFTPGTNNTPGKWAITSDEAIEDGDTLTMAAPSVLAAAPINVSGYEANTVTVELGS